MHIAEELLDAAASSHQSAGSRAPENFERKSSVPDGEGATPSNVEPNSQEKSFQTEERLNDQTAKSPTKLGAERVEELKKEFGRASMRAEDCLWYRVSDKDVSRARLEDVLCSEAYILLYQRQVP